MFILNIIRRKLVLNFAAAIFIVFGFSLFVFNGQCLSGEEESFKLCPWRVGQFVEYQIISFENVGREHRYLISIIGKENIEDRDYFWIRLDIYERERQISFEGLVEPFDEIYFAKHPKVYIREGILFLFKNARRLFVDLPGNYRYEISPHGISNPPDILSGTFYKEVPDEKNNVDYSKLNFTQKKEKISFSAGMFNCYRFWVETKKDDDYTDEGFIMWRSPEVPFLGVVKMKFSITKFYEKLNCKYYKQIAQGDWLSRLYAWFFVRTVPERERKDDCEIEILSYGCNEITLSGEDVF